MTTEFRDFSDRNVIHELRLNCVGISVIFRIFRLHRMHATHEMQPIVTDVCGVRPSVSLSVTRLNSASLCKNGLTDQDDVWGKHS